MKLNNKGFAITAVLYGLLILFVILVSSYLVVLSIKKDRVEDLVNDIENEYTEKYQNRCPNINETLGEGQTYTVPLAGTYIFSITNSNDNNIYTNCSVELEKGNIVLLADSYLKIDNGITVKELFFSNSDIMCDETNYRRHVESINSITYDCE